MHDLIALWADSWVLPLCLLSSLSIHEPLLAEDKVPTSLISLLLASYFRLSVGALSYSWEIDGSNFHEFW